MATELMRVGRSGWVQTPAWSFPMEPHFWAPFMHWFGAPMRARMLSLSAFSHYRNLDLHRRREQVEAINLLSKREVRTLFPERTIYVERLIIAKSYTVRWMPDGQPATQPSPARIAPPPCPIPHPGRALRRSLLRCGGPPRIAPPARDRPGRRPLLPAECCRAQRRPCHVRRPAYAADRDP